MQEKSSFKRSPRQTDHSQLSLAAVSLSALLLAGCGGGSPEQPAATVRQPPPTTSPPPPSNTPPTISGTPPTAVIENEPYEFTPGATDTDGDELSFAILNQPPWARFDPDTGSLTGTPGSAHIGTTAGVTISVSDGKDDASLPAFDLDVLPIPLGSAEVFWDAPASSADGGPLTDLAGFSVHYGLASGDYTTILPVPDPSATRLVVDDLLPGTYFFAVSAYDLSGNQSALSAEVSKLVQP